MRAAVFERYGPPEVLNIQDVPKPVPGDSELLVRVRATTVCAGDVRLWKADPFFLRLLSGILRPSRIKIPGMEFSGTVEAIGKDVTQYAAGDAVFGSTGLKFGACAEYVCVAQSSMLAKKPEGAGFAESACLPFGGVSALHYLRRAQVKSNQHVLVYGASGSVGTYAVQIARHFGAKVTGVCSTSNLELVKSLGADGVIDYTRTDFSRSVQTYDFVFDTVGKARLSQCLNVLRSGGVYASSAAPWAAVFAGSWVQVIGRAKVITGMARTAPTDLSFLAHLVEAGKIRPVIDREYPFLQIADAHRHAETGHKKGNVAVVID